MHSLLELLNILFIAKLPVKDMKEQLQKYDIIMTKEIESEVQNMCNLSFPYKALPGRFTGRF